MIRSRLVLVVLSVLPALAFGQAAAPPVSSVTIEPAAPAAGQAVRVVVQYVQCGAPVPGSEELTVVGNTITFSPLVPIPLCGVPPLTPPVSFPIGVFQPGSYTLVYAPRSGEPTAPWTTISVGFTVGPASVPAGTTAGFAALALALLMLAGWRVRASRRRA